MGPCFLLLLCRVYDTATHTRLGNLERPASAGADASAPCSLLWRGGRELFVCWGRHVTVSLRAQSGRIECTCCWGGSAAPVMALQNLQCAHGHVVACCCHLLFLN